MLANKTDAAFLDVATQTKTSATLVPVSAPTSTFHLVVIPANIATSIPYRQYCFAYHSCRPPWERGAETRCARWCAARSGRRSRGTTTPCLARRRPRTAARAPLATEPQRWAVVAGVDAAAGEASPCVMSSRGGEELLALLAGRRRRGAQLMRQYIFASPRDGSRPHQPGSRRLRRCPAVHWGGL